MDYKQFRIRIVRLKVIAHCNEIIAPRFSPEFVLLLLNWTSLKFLRKSFIRDGWTKTVANMIRDDYDYGEYNNIYNMVLTIWSKVMARF